jgi:hypothetical protein
MIPESRNSGATGNVYWYTRAWSESAVNSLWLAVNRRTQEQQKESPLLDVASELRGHEDIANREDFQRTYLFVECVEQ